MRLHVVAQVTRLSVDWGSACPAELRTSGKDALTDQMMARCNLLNATAEISNMLIEYLAFSLTLPELCNLN